MFKAGFSELAFTPEFGLEIPGYYTPRCANGVLTELCAKAAVFESGDELCGLVVLDIIGGSYEITKKIRERVSKYIPVAPEKLIVFSTHTHTSVPVDFDLYESRKNIECVDRFCIKAADAVVAAYNSRREAVCGYGEDCEASISFNRRFYMKGGGVKMNPGFLNPDAISPEGTVDPQVGVLRFDSPEGKPIALITNFACHLDTVGGSSYCADYPAELSETVKTVLGRDVISIFINGCCGNLNHFDFTKAPSCKPDHYKKMGRLLGYKALSAREKAVVKADSIVKCVTEFMDIPMRQPTPVDLEFARVHANNPSSAVNDRDIAEDILSLYKEPVLTKPAEQQVISIGDTAICSLPGEVFTEIGLEIKKESPFAHTLVGELGSANIGYVAAKFAHDNMKNLPYAVQTMSYETRLSKYTGAVPETGEQFVKTAKKLLDRCK
ncbi:hypothetical protein SDC9_95920 [bioreactor metagenome]|uniref:Neutral/alkaline non-lysosomal ceramidase N-terminal domain-containing protein n=1 Tax=bioreactor metagenome TaxID=1076179 RepID=A0A645A7U8_9ZZZZ|nr:hypothetical protein [Oscillospiraceae bacterium]